MAIQLKHAKGAPKTAQVEYEGESMEVVYRPGAVTPGLVATLNSEDGNRQVDGLVQVLEKVVVQWDLLDDAGKQMPVTKAVLRDLPIPFLMEVLRTVAADTSAPKAS